MKKKVLKSILLVVLSAVMLCGTVLIVAGCVGSKDTATTIRVSILGGANDQASNCGACKTWAEQYTKKLTENRDLQKGENLSAEFSSEADTDA